MAPRENREPVKHCIPFTGRSGSYAEEKPLPKDTEDPTVSVAVKDYPIMVRSY